MKHFLNELISAGNRRKNFFLLLVVLVSSAMLQAQNVAVSGIVKDVTGEPLPGVNIMEKGTTNERLLMSMVSLHFLLRELMQF